MRYLISLLLLISCTKVEQAYSDSQYPASITVVSLNGNVATIKIVNENYLDSAFLITCGRRYPLAITDMQIIWIDSVTIPLKYQIQYFFSVGTQNYSPLQTYRP
jgi:hypothetical protein